jgi:nicotinate-nucleotide adenylyltransferase
MAYLSMEQYQLDKILFIPCNIPNNGKVDISDSSHRINMIQFSIKDEPRFELDLREIKRGGVSYTIDTISEIEQEHKDDALFLIMGYDEVKSFEKWKDYQKIYEKAFLIGF